MGSGKEYDEYVADVRVPKGEQLADSRESEGWKRGYTPKTSDKGPQHVELRIRDRAELPPAHQPEVIYVPERVECPQRQELTPAQQEVANVLSEVLLALIDAAKPGVAQWWETTAVPAMLAKRDDRRQKRQARKAERKAPQAKAATGILTTEPAAKDGSSSQDLAAADGPAITLTSEQLEQLFMTWLAREDSQRALWNAILHAKIQDEDDAALEWRHRLKELTPEERAKRVHELLAANPSMLAGLNQRFMNSGPLELREAIRRRGEA